MREKLLKVVLKIMDSFARGASFNKSRTTSHLYTLAKKPGSQLGILFFCEEKTLDEISGFLWLSLSQDSLVFEEH